jgi:hypothetical protein
LENLERIRLEANIPKKKKIKKDKGLFKANGDPIPFDANAPKHYKSIS